MIYKALDEYSKRDLNPHSHYWPKDFIGDLYACTAAEKIQIRS